LTRRYRQQDPDARRHAAVADALKQLGHRGLPRLSAAQRAMFVRWAPLILAFISQGRWSAGDRQRLLRLVLAKGGPSERDFQRQLLRHSRIRALLDC
jgi:hypothetical protein